MRTLTVLLTVALGSVAMGCGDQAGDICDLECQCRPCNDMEYDDCIIYVQEELDTYAAYQCDKEADDLAQCVLDLGHCDNGHLSWLDVCAPYTQAADNCVERGSALH